MRKSFLLVSQYQDPGRLWYQSLITHIAVSGCANELRATFLRPLSKIFERRPHDRLPKYSPHAGTDNRRVIKLHTAARLWWRVQYKQRIPANSIECAKNCSYIAG